MRSTTSHGLQQDVLLLSEGQLDSAVPQFGTPKHHLVVGHRLVIDTQTATADLSARIAIRCRPAGARKSRQDADAGVDLGG